MLGPHPDFPNLRVLDHPLVADKLTSLREHDTGRRAFRALVEQIAGLMVYEATRSLPARAQRIRTPLEEMEGTRLAGLPTVVPVLRAGLGLAGLEANDSITGKAGATRPTPRRTDCVW